MTVAILLRTQEYRGDHSADVVIAEELLAGETVEALAERLLMRYGDPRFEDWIEVRLVKPMSDPTP